MDLRNAHLPVMCGHYVGDPIAGAEDQIDRHLVDGTLRQRQRLGVYAGEVGSAAVVLMPRSDEDLRRGTGKGAVIVGLGDMGQLTVAQLTETVRAGTLRFLLQSLDREYEGAPALADRPAGGAVPEVERQGGTMGAKRSGRTRRQFCVDTTRIFCAPERSCA